MEDPMLWARFSRSRMYDEAYKKGIEEGRKQNDLGMKEDVKFFNINNTKVFMLEKVGSRGYRLTIRSNSCDIVMPFTGLGAYARAMEEILEHCEISRDAYETFG